MLASSGSIHAGDIGAGSNVTVQAAGDFLLADVIAAGAVDLAAGGLADFRGLVSSPTITVTSRDINVAGGASLGQAGITDLLTLNAVSDGAAIVLGEGEGSFAGHYHLSENGDIVADNVVINAVGGGEGGAPDFLVLNANVDGSDTDGGGISHLTLNTAGSVHVQGAVLFTDAAATDSLTVNAGDRIEVNTSSGGRISMSGSDGSPAGELDLNADNIWVGDQALLDQLAANPNFDGRADALLANNGANNPDGSVSAGSMALGVGATLFVQNTGTTTDFAGITVGEGGLAIHSTGESPATIVAYGRKLNTDGTVSNGGDFLGQIDFDNSGSGFTDGSEVNGCGIGAATCGEVEPPPQIAGAESILGPVGLMGSPDSEQDKDQQNDNDDESEDGSDLGGKLSLGLINTGQLSDDELVDDPVTSGSDSGQWGNDESVTPKEQ